MEQLVCIVLGISAAAAWGVRPFMIGVSGLVACVATGLLVPLFASVKEIA